MASKALNNLTNVTFFMTLLHKALELVDRVWPAGIAHAHCDIPCGIYDPHHAQVAVHTVIRMVGLINEVTQKMSELGDNVTMQDRREFVHKIERYTAVKEEHSEICKKEVRILWGDYFKPEHVQAFPELHELVWKAMKLASKARQEINMEAAEELLATVEKIAEIFWKTKNAETVRTKSFYPTEREIVYPKIK